MSPIKRRISAVAVAVVTIGSLAAGQIAVAQTQQQRETPVVSSKLNLTMEQRYTIKEIVKGLKIGNEPRNVKVEVGEIVPKTVQLRPMPAEVAGKISQVKNHSFFLKNDQVVVVDPKDNMVVDVIDLR